MINGELYELKKTLITQASVLGLNYMYYENIDITEESDDRKIKEIMEACISNDIDPWKINVIEFSRIIGKLVKMGYVTLPEAGYIIMRSWVVVHLQSEELLRSFETVNNHEEIESDEPIEISEVMADDEEKVQWEKIHPPIFHHETRKVMLVELIEVMRETERSQFVRKRPEMLHTASTVENILSVLNMEEPEKDLEDVARNIMNLTEEEFMMEDVWGDLKEEKIKFFLYCMYLQRRGMINMDQEVSYESIRIRKSDQQT